VRLTEHLTEKRVTIAQQNQINDFEGIYAPAIEKNCSQMLDFYKAGGSRSKLFFRGVNESEDFIEKTMRTTVRRPRNTDKKTHIRLNKLMKEKFGWKVRDGVSTTTGWSQTQLYGRAYIFFPFNKFKFVYSNEMYDLIQHIKMQPIGMPDKEWEPKEMRSLKRLVNKHQDTDLAGAFMRSGEVLFKMKKYYLLNYDFKELVSQRWGI
jgi:hypothetical protein